MLVKSASLTSASVGALVFQTFHNSNAATLTTAIAALSSHFFNRSEFPESIAEATEDRE